MEKNIQNKNIKDDFEILYNALSLGWHLRKITEISPDILSTTENKDRFDAWLARHMKIPVKLK